MADNSFLRPLAQFLNLKLGSQLNDTVFVFPNRRAGLFFRKYLAEARNEVFLAPQTLTINDLFDQLSEYPLNTDRIDLILTLHEVYSEVSRQASSLDDFMFWGQMMLSDFDEIDDHLVDAAHLFVETRNLKELDTVFGLELTEEQREAIKALFGENTIDDESMKGRFARMWNYLAETHRQFVERLISDGKGVYKGLQHKLVIDKLSGDAESAGQLWSRNFGNKQLIFVGFNALTRSEEMLLEFAKGRNADFYWDYSSEDLRNLHGSLYAVNTAKFPSRMPMPLVTEPRLTDFNGGEKVINLYTISSDIAQAKVAAYLLARQIGNEGDGKESFENTAVVLPKEELLLPLLDSLDPRIQHINVTMGYPMIATPIYALLDYLCQLQLKHRETAGKVTFYHKDVESILNHSYVRRWESMVKPSETAMDVYDKQVKGHRIYSTEEDLQRNDLLCKIFRVADKDSLIAYLIDICTMLYESGKQYEQDAEDMSQQDIQGVGEEQIFLAQTLDMLAKLQAKFPDRSPLEMTGMVRLIKQLSATETISFRGEPLHGLQIMGALEARALDFSNLIILSLNEGVFPKPSSTNTCLPYMVRRAYGLPTHELADSVESYNFYRMLLHAQKVSLVCDIRQNSEQRGEFSRFIMQLRYKYGVTVNEIQVMTGSSESTVADLVPKVYKDESILQKISDTLLNEKRGISASAIKNYLKCPLKFYLNNIEYISEENRLEDEIQSNEFGNVVHHALELIYKEAAQKQDQNLITRELLESLLQHDGMNNLVERKIEDAFREDYLRNDLPFQGQDEMIYDVVQKYVRVVLARDRDYAPFYFLGGEYKFRDKFVTLSSGQEVVINGSIDRIDLKQQADGSFVLRVIDYKTGSPMKPIEGVGDMFNTEKDEAYNAMQACLYCLVLALQLQRKTTGFYNEILLPDILHGNKLVIEPHLFYVRNIAGDKESSSQIMLKSKDSVVWSGDVPTQFTALLANMLGEVLNPDIPFAQTEYEEQCMYCPFGDLCKRETEPRRSK